MELRAVNKKNYISFIFAHMLIFLFVTHMYMEWIKSDGLLLQRYECGTAKLRETKRWMTYGIYLFGFALDFIYHLRKKM